MVRFCTLGPPARPALGEVTLSVGQSDRGTRRSEFPDYRGALPERSQTPTSVELALVRSKRVEVRSCRVLAEARQELDAYLWAASAMPGGPGVDALSIRCLPLRGEATSSTHFER